MFVTLEWTWTDKQLLIQVGRGPLDHYMRLSLIFGSWLLLYLTLLSKQAVPAIVKFISKCSLGIYGFHVFFTFRKPLNLDSIIFLSNLFKAVPFLEVLAIFLMTLIGSIALTLLCKRSKFLSNFI
jgi:surface polysaccharide O-acyltransferase-like enzyme